MGLEDNEYERLQRRHIPSERPPVGPITQIVTGLREDLDALSAQVAENEEALSGWSSELVQALEADHNNLVESLNEVADKIDALMDYLGLESVPDDEEAYTIQQGAEMWSPDLEQEAIDVVNRGEAVEFPDDDIVIANVEPAPEPAETVEQEAARLRAEAMSIEEMVERANSTTVEDYDHDHARWEDDGGPHIDGLD